MDKRFLQAKKEAIITLLLTITYLFAWVFTAYFFDNQLGIFSMPIWFELSCIFVPLLFIVICWLTIKLHFKNIPLDSDESH